MIFIAGFILGIASSLHCAGMCGPLILGMPFTKKKFIQEIVIYYTGKTISYTLMGLIFGLLGFGLYLAKFQQLFSVIGGVFVLLFVIFQYKFNQKLSLPFVSKTQHFLFKVGFNFKNKLVSFFILGLANGLLPCGLLYIVLASAVALGSISFSMLYMIGFSTGTMPVLVAVFYLKNMFVLKHKKIAKMALPLMSLFIAALLIFRGLNLGIKNMSPKIDKNKIECCK